MSDVLNTWRCRSHTMTAQTRIDVHSLSPNSVSSKLCICLKIFCARSTSNKQKYWFLEKSSQAHANQNSHIGKHYFLTYLESFVIHEKCMYSVCVMRIANDCNRRCNINCYISNFKHTGYANVSLDVPPLHCSSFERQNSVKDAHRLQRWRYLLPGSQRNMKNVSKQNVENIYT